MSTLVYQFLSDKLQPYINPQRARTLAGQIAANLTVAKGARLGQLSSGIYTTDAVAKIAAPVSGPTLSASGTDGTLPAGDYKVAYSFKTATGETPLSPSTIVSVSATNHIAVTTIALPTGATGVNVYITDADGNDFHFQYTNNGTGVSITDPSDSAVEPPTANTAYVASDGSQTPKVISAYDFITDADGNVFYGTQVPTSGPLAISEQTAELYYTGDFLKSDLPGITDDEIAQMGATTQGVGANAIVRLP